MVRWARIGCTVALVVASLGCGARDAELNRQVLIRLSREATPTEQLNVKTHGNVVTLSGVVHSATEREQLERAVREVTGVARVDNKLVIDAPVELTAGTYLRHDPVDTLLRDDVLSRLAHGVNDEIRVDVADRVVTLTGNVSRAAHDAAMKSTLELEQHGARIVDHMTVDEVVAAPAP